MLRSRVVCPAASALAATAGVTSSGRGFHSIAPDPIGKAHPDVYHGVGHQWYRGRGWVAAQKQLPAEAMVQHGGDSMTCMNDRHGMLMDPEDPRHPMMRVQFGPEHQKGLDNAVHALVGGTYGPIPSSTRLLQVLYNNYLEPISMNRVSVPLMHLSKVPNNGWDLLVDSLEYIGQTANFIGNAYAGVGSTVLEGCTLRGDTNQVIIHECAQIMENVVMIADAPTTLYHYQRQEAFNPYQTLEVSEGVVKIGNNTIVEPNCLIEACNISTFNRIGHGTKILKGVTTSPFCHILPGSVVLSDTHMSEGEIWGGAPAVKLGKVAKFEYKKPWYPSLHHREMTAATKHCGSARGDQVVLWMEEMDKLDALMLQFEDHLSPGVKAQIAEFVEGREPFGHSIARLTQGWTPASRPDDKLNDHRVPSVYLNSYRNHNDDYHEHAGSIFHWKAYLSGAERRW